MKNSIALFLSVPLQLSTMKIYMNKTTIFSLTITLWGHHLFSVALTKDDSKQGSVEPIKYLEDKR